jgi:hypothetical protein
MVVPWLNFLLASIFLAFFIFVQAKHRTRDWWLQQFHAAGLKEDEEKSTHFNAAMLENGNKTSYHIFHLIVPSFSIARYFKLHLNTRVTSIH